MNESPRRLAPGLDVDPPTVAPGNTTRAVVTEFLGAAMRPNSRALRSNPYVRFGLSWGLGLPFFLVLHHATQGDGPVSVAHVVSALVGDPASLAALVFPFALAWVFGTLGTVRLEKKQLLDRTIALLDHEVEERTQALRDAYQDTVLALSEAIEAKDAYTRGHCNRVWRYAHRAANKLSVGGSDLTILRFAAYLHDVGKIHVPRAVLHKPGRLTDEEFAIIKEHTVHGERIVASVNGLGEVARLVRSHHEREDGTGYPDGLMGDELPLLAKILAAADALDAMLSDRPYRRGMDPALAAHELRRCAGLPFDPDKLPGRDHEPRHHFDAAVVLAMVEPEITLAPPSRAMSRASAELTAAPLYARRAAGLPLGHRPSNCWEVLGCGQGPDETLRPGTERCPVPSAAAYAAINDGRAGGRICWAVPGALCRRGLPVELSVEQKPCASCSFFAQVRREQGLDGLVLNPVRGRGRPCSAGVGGS